LAPSARTRGNSILLRADEVIEKRVGFAALHESGCGPSQKLPRPTRASAYRGYRGHCEGWTKNDMAPISVNPRSPAGSNPSPCGERVTVRAEWWCRLHDLIQRPIAGAPVALVYVVFLYGWSGVEKRNEINGR
jgi:hypothetical protein